MIHVGSKIPVDCAFLFAVFGAVDNHTEHKDHKKVILKSIAFRR